jgi:uncharacterized protein YxeA
MKTLLIVIALLVVPVLISAGVHWHKYNLHVGEASWSIQGQDDAIQGCPRRYHEWVDLPDHGRVLIGCWGDR